MRKVISRILSARNSISKRSDPMLNLTLRSTSVPSYDGIHEGDNAYLQLRINEFGGQKGAGHYLWVVYRIAGERTFTSDRYDLSSMSSDSDSFTVDLKNCILVAPGKLEVQVVLTTSSDNLLKLMEDYAAGTETALIIKSRVYEFYINPSLDPTEGIIAETGGISQTIKDYLDDLVSQIIEEGFELNIDTELSSSSRNPVENRVLKAELDKKLNAEGLDAALSATSTNPVQNKVIKAAIDSKQDKLTIDAALSASSTNPVQNKVIKGALDEKLSEADLNTRISTDIQADRTSTTKLASPKAVADYVSGGTWGALYAGERTLHGIMASDNKKLYSISLPSLPIVDANTIMERVLRNQAEELFFAVRPSPAYHIDDRILLQCTGKIWVSPYVAVLYFEGIYDDKRYCARIAIKPRNSTSTLTPFDCSLDSQYNDFTDDDALVECTFEATMLKVEPILTEDDIPAPPTVPTKVSQLQNDEGYLTDASAATAGFLKTESAVDAGFCRNTIGSQDSILAVATNIGNMSGSASELQSITFYSTYFWEGDGSQSNIFDVWNNLVSQYNRGTEPSYRTSQGDSLPLTFVDGTCPYFAFNVTTPGYDGANSAITLLDIYVPDTSKPAVLIQKLTDAVGVEPYEIHLYLTENRSNDAITFAHHTTYRDYYAKERYVDSAISDLQNGLTLVDTSTGTKYKLTVVNGQLNLAAIS